MGKSALWTQSNLRTQPSSGDSWGIGSVSQGLITPDMHMDPLPPHFACVELSPLSEQSKSNLRVSGHHHDGW